MRRGVKQGRVREREGETKGERKNERESDKMGHQIERLHAEFCKNILHVQRKTPSNLCRAELGQYPLIIKIQKDIKFYNHLKESDFQTFHNKAINYREMNLEKTPLSKWPWDSVHKHKPPPYSPRTAPQLAPTKS